MIVTVDVVSESMCIASADRECLPAVLAREYSARIPVTGFLFVIRSTNEQTKLDTVNLVDI